MKRRLLLALLTIVVVSSAAALSADIDSSGDEIVLSSNNGYTVSKTFDGSDSDGATDHSWAIRETAQTGEGPEYTVTFDRSNPRKNTVTLTTFNESEDSKTTTFNQIIHDKPDVTVSSSTSSIDEGDTVDFTSTVDDEIENSSLDYSWTVDGSQEGTSETFSYSFSNSGTYTVRLTVTDAAGYSGTDASSISVSSANNNDNNDDGGNGFGGSSTLDQEDDEETTAEDDSASDESQQDESGASRGLQVAESKINTALGDDVDVTSTASSKTTSHQASGLPVQAITTTYSTTQGPITEVNVSPDTSQEGNRSDRLRITIPKSDTNSTDAIHGNYTVVERDPVIETSSTSTLYVEGETDTSTWSFKAAEQQQNQSQQEDNDKPQVESDNGGSADFFTPLQYVYLLIGFIVLFATAIYFTNRVK